MTILQDERISPTPGSLQVFTAKFEFCQSCLKKNHQPLATIFRLNKKHQRYEVKYLGKKIGIMRPGGGCWKARANLQYSGKEAQLTTQLNAVNWLVENYLKIAQAGIKLEVSENFYHYTIARGYWLIKIDVREEDCLATIQDGNDLLFEYFPTLNDAISFSFDLILNSDRSTDSSCDEEEF